MPDGEFKKAPRDSCSVHALESSSPTKLDMLHNSKHSTPNSECSPQDLFAGPPPPRPLVPSHPQRKRAGTLDRHRFPDCLQARQFGSELY